MQILLLKLCFSHILMMFRYALNLIFHSLIYEQTWYDVVWYCHCTPVTHMHKQSCCWSYFLAVWAV